MENEPINNISHKNFITFYLNLYVLTGPFWNRYPYLF